MIVFNLVCDDCEYPFEGWFDNEADFKSQKKRKFINYHHKKIKIKY